MINLSRMYMQNHRSKYLMFILLHKNYNRYGTDMVHVSKYISYGH